MPARGGKGNHIVVSPGLFSWSGFAAEFSRLLQAVEVIGDISALESAAGQANCIQKRVRSDGAVARIGEVRANDPDRSSISPGGSNGVVRGACTIVRRQVTIAEASLVGEHTC
jgi:hypothetical protein